MNLLIYSQTSMVAPLKFRKYVNFIFHLTMDVIIHACHVSFALTHQYLQHQMLYCQLLHMLTVSLFNSLAPGRWCTNFGSVISKDMLPIRFMSISCDITLRWMPQNTVDTKLKQFYLRFLWNLTRANQLIIMINGSLSSGFWLHTPEMMEMQIYC